MKQLEGNTLTMCVVAELLRRLGGEGSISQEDIDLTHKTYGHILEGWGPGAPGQEPLVLKLERKGPPQ